MTFTGQGRVRPRCRFFHANGHVLNLQAPPMMKENWNAARGCQRSIIFLGALTPDANVAQAHHSYPILSPSSTHGKQATYLHRYVGILVRLAMKLRAAVVCRIDVAFLPIPPYLRGRGGFCQVTYFFQGKVRKPAEGQQLNLL